MSNSLFLVGDKYVLKCVEHFRQAMQELRTSYDQICADYHELIKDMEGNKVKVTRVSE